MANLSDTNVALISKILNFDTEAGISLAYHNNYLTFAVDYFLIENQPLLANSTFDGLKIQCLAVDVELNIFDYRQLRLSAIKNAMSGITYYVKYTAITA